jgi:protein SCO1/2
MNFGTKHWLAAAALIGWGLPAVPAEHGAGAMNLNMSAQPGDASKQLILSTVHYDIPAISLVRSSGESVTLTDELNDGRAVVVNFIYTTCPGVCPLSSQVFARFQRKLGSDRTKVHLLSISIDPEADTPAALTEYAKRFDAGNGWDHYTGSMAASLAAQRAFDVYHGDKMSHTPVTLIRLAPGKPWRRIDGFASADQLLHEYHSLLRAG